MKYLSIVATVGIFAASQTGYSIIIVDNGAPNLASGNEVTQWIQAEDFQLAVPSSITSAQFWTIESNDSTWDGALTWYLFNNMGNQPGSIIASGAAGEVIKTATGRYALDTYGEYVYDFSLTGVPMLEASTTYWFGLHLSHNFDLDGIYWETTDMILANGHESEYGTSNWENNFQEHAFNLSGGTAIPDATSAALLLGLALTSLGILSNRWKA